jgi:hypothetical protein
MEAVQLQNIFLEHFEGAAFLAGRITGNLAQVRSQFSIVYQFPPQYIN